MKDLDLLHFEQLKSEIEQQHLLYHTPTSEKISEWKGIDIIYFQEDLRKKTKATISEKSFYNYFKTSPVTKLPRIDILNILSQYVDYASWSDFKKNHDYADEILKNFENNSNSEVETSILYEEKEGEKPTQKHILQKSNTDNQINTENSSSKKTIQKNRKFNAWWAFVLMILVGLIGVLIFKDDLFSKKFTYTFTDSDRNSKINDVLSVKILKENESPLTFKVKPNSPFVYTTKSKTLKMVVSSPFYKIDTIYRNLETANSNENIELKPNDYAIMLYYYSKSIENLKQKRRQLDRLISNNALIYQVYDNTMYGVETLDKRKYINLVTTPTTSLKNLEVIDTQLKNNKIILIKFKIKSDESTP